MNNNSAPFQNRNVTLDLMKALAIFLVVMDHLLIAADGEENAFRVFIYSLHIPLFFIVSGYLASAKIYRVSDVFHFVKKKSRLLIPLLVFSLGDIIILKSDAKDWLTWHKFGLWFLWVLFLFFIIYSISQLLLIKNKNKFLEIAILLAPVLVCVILRKWQDSIIGGVFNFLNLYNYVFFILGVLVRRYGWEKVIMRENVSFLLFAIWGVGLATGYPFLNIPMKVGGILFCYVTLEKIYARKLISLPNRGGNLLSILTYIGSKSLYIYILHFYLLGGLQRLPDDLHDIVFGCSSLYLLFYTVVAIFVIGVCLLIEKILNSNAIIRIWFFGGKR